MGANHILYALLYAFLGALKSYITVSEVGLELPSSLKSGFPRVLHLQSTV